jgi:hypothetical protein
VMRQKLTAVSHRHRAGRSGLGRREMEVKEADPKSIRLSRI